MQLFVKQTRLQFASVRKVLRDTGELGLDWEQHVDYPGESSYSVHGPRETCFISETRQCGTHASLGYVRMRSMVGEEKEKGAEPDRSMSYDDRTILEWKKSLDWTTQSV